MSDEQERSAQGGKVITGDVGAQAGAAGVALNQTPPLHAPFFVEERVHHRIQCLKAEDETNGTEYIRRTMIEYVVHQGETPEGYLRFQGVGLLVADTDMGKVQRDYRFRVHGATVEEAWQHFDRDLAVGAEEAKAKFLAEYEEAKKRQREQILVPGPGAAQGLVGPGGRPLHPGG